MNKRLYGYQKSINFFCFSVFGLSVEARCNEQPEKPTDLFQMSLEDLLNLRAAVGSRGSGRSLNQSPVPTDVVSHDELISTGFIELGPALRRLLPYFNYQDLTQRDGTDHSRPFSLRGMDAGQVLVLVNGKRYHSSALTHLSTALGRGSNSVDLNNFPLYSIPKFLVLDLAKRNETEKCRSTIHALSFAMQSTINT